MTNQDLFNEHVDKISSLKGKAVDLQNMKWIGLTREEETELKRLEATLPNILEDDMKLFSKIVNKEENVIAIKVEIKIKYEDFSHDICRNHVFV